MKNILYIIIINSIFINSCDCYYCTDTISELNKKILYTDSTLIEFKNDTLGIIQDTIFVWKGEVSKKPYHCTGGHDDDLYLCSASSYIKYSNLFRFDILQLPNLYQNEIGIGYSYDKNEYTKTDTIEITYNNKIIKACHTYFKTDSLNSIIWKINVNEDSTYAYDDYIYIIEPEIKLIEYSTKYKNGMKRKWKLKE